MHFIRLVTALVCLAATVSASAETATARVVEVGENNGIAWVRVSVGRIDGLGQDDPVMLLRQAAPIVHPLTGEVLGVPEEPVGLMRVESLAEQQAEGRLIRSYTAPRVGDVAEYQRRTATAPGRVAPPSPPPPEPGSAGRTTAGDVRQAAGAAPGHADADHSSATTDHAQVAVWDELASMQHYLRSIERRLDNIEREHREASARPSPGRSDTPAGDTREFTIRYSAGTDVRLRLAGHTLLVSVEPDSLRLTEADPAPSPRVEPVPVAPMPPAVGTDGEYGAAGARVSDPRDGSGAAAVAAETPLPMAPASVPAPADCSVVAAVAESAASTTSVGADPEAYKAPLAAGVGVPLDSTVAVGPVGGVSDTVLQGTPVTLGGRLLTWLTSPYAQAGSLVVIAAMAGVLFYLMRRREDDLTAQLAELEGGPLGDDGPDRYLR